jgi:AbrB family looped-hinge helix DNA binding protein
MKTTIDSAGRVVIPKALRQQAGLAAGQELRAEYRDGVIVIEPAPRKVRVVREGYLLVAVAPPETGPLTNEQVKRAVGELRGERSRK